VPSFSASSAATTSFPVRYRPPPWRAVHEPPPPKVSGEPDSAGSPSASSLSLTAAEPRSTAAAHAGRRPPLAAVAPPLQAPSSEIEEGNRSPAPPCPFSPFPQLPPWPRTPATRPPAPQPPPPLFLMGGRRRSGKIAQRPLPFPLFYKEPFHSFTFLQMNPCPLLYSQINPSTIIAQFQLYPYTFPEWPRCFQKLQPSPCPSKIFTKRPFNPCSTPKPPCNLSFHAPKILQSPRNFTTPFLT